MQKDKRFDFRVSVQEKAEIKDLADLYGMNVSAYVRETALGYEPIYLIDIEKIELLIQKNSELSRLGNLLKIWVLNDPKYSIKLRANIELKLPEVLDEIFKIQAEMDEIVDAILNN